MTERVLCEVQVEYMLFLRRVHSVTRSDKMRSCEIRKALNVYLLLLQIESPLLCWFGRAFRMFLEILAMHVLLATLTVKRSIGRPRTLVGLLLPRPSQRESGRKMNE